MGDKNVGGGWGVIFLGGTGGMRKFSAGRGNSSVWKTLWCAIFGFKSSTIVVFMILQMLHVLGKSFSSYIRKYSRPIRLQDFLSFNITKFIRGIKFLF